MTRVIKFHVILISMILLFFILNNIGEGNPIMYINNMFLTLFSVAYIIFLMTQKEIEK